MSGSKVSVEAELVQHIPGSSASIMPSCRLVPVSVAVIQRHVGRTFQFQLCRPHPKGEPTVQGDCLWHDDIHLWKPQYFNIAWFSGEQSEFFCKELGIDIVNFFGGLVQLLK